MQQQFIFWTAPKNSDSALVKCDTLQVWIAQDCTVQLTLTPSLGASVVMEKQYTLCGDVWGE